MLTVEPHPLLDLAAFETRLPRPLGELTPPEALVAMLSLEASAPSDPRIPFTPFTPSAPTDEVRKAVRDLLRHGGYKPTGRGKPASEYLLRAAGEGGLSSINAVVDACNVASLHSGLPISVVDLAKATPPFVVRIADEGASHVFNAAGQTIDVSGLLALHDAEGPCANAVKDAQRTKTDDDTTRTLSVVWGTRELPGRTDELTAWYRELVESIGATTEAVPVSNR